ncbi:MAG: amidase [Deltaproteobacteria bacterium]|nr:amidase [Deltaproteobacteria bacterium]
MRLDEYADYDALGLAALIRGGDVSAAEVRRCAAAAARGLNPQLNAIVELFEDRCSGGDPQADPAGVFGGVPYFLKDLGAAEEGRRCEMGSRMLRGYVADKTSSLVKRFKQAGLVNLGRTTTPEAGFAGTTESVATGKTRNPWNLGRSPGGSSGGAAAVVAAGVVPLAHGSDGAGSIRIPAALCGLVGLKPSRGRVSFGPDFDEPILGCAMEFALTRTVRDAAALLDAVAGPYPGDPFVLPKPSRSYLEELAVPVGRLRVAFTTNNWCTGAKVAPAIAEAVRRTAGDLEAMGHMVEEIDPVFDARMAYEANRLAFNSVLLLLGPIVAALGGRVDAEHAEPVILDAYRQMQCMSAEEFFVGTLAFNLARRQLGEFFETYDMLVTPTIGVSHVDFDTIDCSSFQTVEAFRDALEATVGPFTSPFNVTGQPALTLPLAQFDDTTPLGVQFVGRMAQEHTLLKVAAALEQARPWRDRRPALHAGSSAAR